MEGIGHLDTLDNRSLWSRLGNAGSGAFVLC